MVIPSEIYRHTERMLRRCHQPSELWRAYRDAERDAGSIPMPVPGSAPGARSGQSRTEASAGRLISIADKIDEEMRWRQLVVEVDAYFAESNPSVLAAARLLYQGQLSQEDVCRQLELDRKSVRQRRDTYVCHCALLAVQYGLITIVAEGGRANA